MSRLPSIYEHTELNLAYDSFPSSERIQNNLLDIELGRGAAQSGSGSDAADTPPSYSVSVPLAAGSASSSVMDYGHSSSDLSHATSSQTHSESPFAHSPLSQDSLPQPTPSKPYFTTSSGDPQDQHRASGSQTAPTRPTPASSFSALFPPPQPVSSVTTVHSNNPHPGTRPSSSSSKSSQSPLPSARYKPYSRPPDHSGHYNSLTPKSSGSPVAAPSLSSSISSTSLSGSRPSSRRSFSAAGFTSPQIISSSSPFTPGSSNSTSLICPWRVSL